MAIPFWPYTFLKPTTITRHLAPRTTVGTVAISGFTQRVSPGAHAWNIQYGNILIWTAEQLRWWDYIAGILDGGANPVYVYLLGEDNGGSVNGTVPSAQGVGSTSITLSRSVPILAGHHFSIDQHLYRVIGASPTSGSEYAVTIRPPLRANITVGGTAFFINPVCKMRLATDDEMMLELDPARMGTQTVKFVEDPNP